MIFKNGDVVRVKSSVEEGHTYDGIFIGIEDDFLFNNDFIVVKKSVDNRLRDGSTLVEVYGTGVMYPANIFDKVGEVDVSKAQKNTDHYFKSKKYYPSTTDYIYSRIKSLVEDA